MGQSGVWERVLHHFAADADNEYAMIDSTIVRAHQHSANGARTRSWASKSFSDQDVSLHRYEEHHLIESLFAKQFRAIATRYGRTARNFLAAVHLTAAAIWLN